MRGLILSTLSVTLFACGSVPRTHPGGVCEPDRTCDDGQICDQTDPAGPVCLDASGDIDGDGIPNGQDFCEHMPGGGHDEDGDGIGDDCDPCPIARPPATPDPDGDAVDSPCDPDPRTPGDKIVLFNGFNTAMPGIPSTWKILGGEAIMTPASPDTIERLSFPLALPSVHMAILAGYRIDGVSTGAVDADAGVVSLNNLPMGSTTIECGGSRIGTADRLHLKIDAATVTKDMMNLFDPASLYRVAEQVEGATANCALISDTETGAVQGSSSGVAMSQVGVYARGATARFAYVLVIDTNRR